MTVWRARMDAGANTGAPSPNWTLRWLRLAVSRMTLSPARMDAGANTGAPSPNGTLPWLRVAVSRMTLSPARMGRELTLLMECLLFAGSLFPIPRQPKSTGTKYNRVLVLGRQLRGIDT